MTEEQNCSTHANSSTTPAPQQANQARILLVEDEPVLLRAIQTMISAMGYDVIPSLNESDALILFRDNTATIDLVITDFALPQKSGQQFLLALQDINPDVKIVVMTSYNLKEQESAFLKAYGCGFLRKPFNYSQLREAIVTRLKN